MMQQRPQPAEHAPFYAGYVALVPENDVLAAMRVQAGEVAAMLQSIDEAQAVMLHPPYTWTIKQVVGHINDGERIFGYRALRIARGDPTPLPGFDENDYARAPEFSRLRLPDLAEEFSAVRHSTLRLFESLSPESWTRMGTANSNPVSVRAIAYIIVGHVRHHMTIVRRRLNR